MSSCSLTLLRPKDEADLLRRGLVNVHGNRMPSGAPPNLPEGYFDEIELLKKRFTNKQRSISPNQEYEKNKENANRTMMCGHYGVGNDPSVENYITDAEVNTRGYKDRLGRVFYGIPLLKDPKEKATKAANVPAAQNVVVTNNRSERSIRDYNPNVQTISSEPFSLEKSSDDSSSDTSDVHNAELSMRSGIHAIDCNVGKGADCGRLRYLIQRDGRSYQLQGPHNEEVFLEFNKKGASLTSTFIGKSKSKWIGVRSKRKSKEESSSAIEI
ncbi:unnamed protein product [Toxocara canis]|uniref:Maternal effect embryo arrest 59 n=1 Tax=Toxocara canis TaxID=6265 RepID=A0A183V9K7_TOXCA|nr:unnamed protein product [Toxocara canis]